MLRRCIFPSLSSPSSSSARRVLPSLATVVTPSATAGMYGFSHNNKNSFCNNHCCYVMYTTSRRWHGRRQRPADAAAASSKNKKTSNENQRRDLLAVVGLCGVLFFVVFFPPTVEAATRPGYKNKDNDGDDDGKMLSSDTEEVLTCGYTSGSGVYQPYYRFFLFRWVRCFFRLCRIIHIVLPLLWAVYRRRDVLGHDDVAKKFVLDLLIETVEKLGPAYVKLSQWASTRPDIFGPDVATALHKMTFNAPTHSLEVTQKTLRRELGKERASELYNVSPTPLGSGCIAQVHSATHLPTGRKVAVKVLHPNVAHNINIDLDLMCGLAWLATSLAPQFSHLALADAVLEFSGFMRTQLDLRVEARNLDIFRLNFEDAKEVVFPKPYHELTTADCLVESFEAGETVHEYLKEQHPAHLRCELAQIGIQMFLKMVFIDNFVHADLHPGNILVRMSPQRSHQLVVLDPGLVTVLTNRDRSNFLSLFAAVAVGDGRLGAQLMKKHARKVWACADEKAYIRDMQRIFASTEQSGGFQLSRVSIGSVLQDVLYTVFRHGIQIESNFTTLVSSIAVLEGVGRQLDPKLNIFASSAPFLVSVLSTTEVAHLAPMLKIRYMDNKNTSFIF
eukprot:PhM_4_TR8052/c0_g1_i1/m.7093/K08869/ADCK, ABC1; aarF domain-containing kinase